MTKIKLGKVTFTLKEPQDFSWVLTLGEPFAVFDQNDSGNVSFGVEKNGERLFVKYAGALTENAAWSPQNAIDALRRTGELYEDLRHPGLIDYLGNLETEHGYAMIFRWVEGECLHPHWTFDERPKHTHPDSPYVKFRALPLEKKQAAAEILFDFMAFAQSKGYVAVDLYDSSLMYDFDTDTFKICDIDLFEKGPLLNETGDWLGSARFKAPEEFEAGGIVDFTSNVYTVGKILLMMFAGEEHPDREHWEETEARWQVLQKALSPAKADRYADVAEFWQAWEAAQ